MKSVVVPDKGILEDSGENLPCVPSNMWAHASPKIVSSACRVAAGKMQSFAVCRPYRKHKYLPLQYPLFLKEVCAIVFCAIQAQSPMALRADMFFLLSFCLG